MSVNGITSTTEAYVSAYKNASASKATETAGAVAADNSSASSKATEAGAVYEPSKEAVNAKEAASTKKTYKADKAMIAKLKADADARTEQLRSLVEKMMSKQTETYGKANNIWKFLASGNYTVDPATKAQAQADIAEDGYWGVSQTSSRILDFATALTGGDPGKIEEMRAAFKKGYEQAEKTWGGKLPEISQKTYDAVMEGFDKLAKEAGIQTEN